MNTARLIFTRFIAVNTALYALVLCVLITACKSKDDEGHYLGSIVKSATNDFIAGDICMVQHTVNGPGMVCESGSYEPQFEATFPNACYFNCDFNQEVTWTITITGRTSGAVKTMTGTSMGLPFGNTLSIWKGDATGFRFFKRAEVCDVKITFQGSSIVRNTTVTIKNQPNGPLGYKLVSGVKVLDNIDAGGSTSFTYSYVDLGDDNNNTISLSRGDENIKPVEGDFMLRLKGRDVNSNTYLGGTGPELLTSHVGAIRNVVPSGETDASQLYFNMYVYGTGLNNTNLQIRAYEFDALSNSGNDPVPSYGINEEKTNDQWAYDLYVNWTGWKLVSIPYTAFKPSNNPMKGGNGNRIKEPRKITAYNLMLQSMPNPGAEVEAYVDFITLTWSAPFKQNF